MKSKALDQVVARLSVPVRSPAPVGYVKQVDGDQYLSFKQFDPDHHDYWIDTGWKPVWTHAGDE